MIFRWRVLFTLFFGCFLLTAHAQYDAVKAAEYFWDTDPGPGNGTPMYSTNGSFTQAFATIYQNTDSLPAVGLHTLNIRAEDTAGNWGRVFTEVINVESSSTATRADGVVAAEYFFDTDPGQGNGTPMLALEGNFGNAFQEILGGAIPAPVTSGIHLLCMRAKDVAGNWGNVFRVVVNIDTTISAPSVQITGPAALCTNDLAGVAYSTPSGSGYTYSWALTGGIINSGAGTNSVVVTWNSTGPYQLKVTTCAGAICDSDSISLTVNPVLATTVNYTMCHGFVFDGYSTGGTFVDTFTASTGCDSIRTLNLTVLPVTDTAITQIICQGQSFLGYNQTGNYIDTLTGHNGCDSIRTLNLTVINIIQTTVSLNLCQGLSYDGHSTNGTFVDTFTAIGGCDSLRTLNLTILAVSQSTTTQTICQGLTYYGHSTTGTFNDTLTGSNGCDSIRTLNLTVLPVKQDTITTSICSGTSYLGYSQTGIYLDTLTGSDGCDSIRVLNLTVNNSNQITVDEDICTGQGYDGHTATGTYIDTFTSVGGCDSIRTLNLIVLPTLTTTDDEIICQGISYDGHRVTGTFVDTLTSVYGCDSIRTLYLTVNPVTVDTIYQSICEGDTFSGHNTTGVYTDSLISVSGCDSVVTLNLIVNPLPAEPTITRYADTLEASLAAHYQWFRDSIVLAGDTLWFIIVSQNGNYSVEASDSESCSNSSSVVPVINVGIRDINDIGDILVFPNPTTDILNVQWNGLTAQAVITLKLNDAIGRALIEKTISAKSVSFTTHLSLQSLAPGVYFLNIYSGKEMASFKVVKTN